MSEKVKIRKPIPNTINTVKNSNIAVTDFRIGNSILSHVIHKVFSPPILYTTIIAWF